MNSTLTFLTFAVAVPAAIAAILLLTLRRVLPADFGQRFAGPLAFGIACVVGGALANGFVFPPERHWQWIPILALGSGLIGGIAASKALRVIDRFVLQLLACLVAAWLIVPDWSSLTPPRLVWIGGLVPALGLLAAALEPLASRVPNPTRIFSFAIAALGVASLTAAFLSLTYGVQAIVPAASLLGCFFGSLVGKGAPIQGLGLPYAIVVGGWAFVGTIDPPEPLWWLSVAALAPLGLWCTALGPAAKLRGWTGIVARVGGVIAVLAVSAAGLVATMGLP